MSGGGFASCFTVILMADVLVFTCNKHRDCCRLLTARIRVSTLGQMHQGRMRLRPWLEEQIRSGRYPGVTWLDETAGVFQIPWKHAARHGWNIDKDATLFRNWAMHTGRYKPGIDKPDPKTWKANFRCALNSLPDVKELHDRSTKKGNNAFRVYMLLPSIKTPKRRKGLRESDFDVKYSGSGLFSYSDTVQSGMCPPLEHFPDAFSRYREGEAGYSPGFRCHRDSSSITMESNQDYFFTPLPLHSDPSGNMHSPATSNEHAQAVLKIVEHLKNTEHWNQSNDNIKSWSNFYGDGMDHCGPFQTDYHAYGGQQRPFFP